MELYGIDVSDYNPVTSYSSIAKEGKKVAILRVTERNNQKDPSFEKNYSGFRQAGLKVGVYKFSYALSISEAEAEAESVLEALKGKKLDFPVFYDLEWSGQRSLPKSQLNAIINVFSNKILKAGYYFGIYCNMDWYRNVLDVSSLPYDYWIAAYPYNDRGVLVEKLRPPVGIGWQYSSKGSVEGIAGAVDLDVFYKDYGENGETPTPKDKWIERLQQAIGAAADNIPGPETLSKCPILQLGSSGEVVCLLQERLENVYGISVPGGIDGIFGEGTCKAVEKFQEQQGLNVDGMVGPKTWEKLLGL